MSIFEAFKWDNILEGLKRNEYSIMAIAFPFQKNQLDQIFLIIIESLGEYSQ